MSKKDLILLGPAGDLQAIYEAPKDIIIDNLIMIICHPHPKHEGTMHNKVITTIARAAYKQGIETIRFNYRGVMNSQGEYGNGVGEVDDLLSVITYVRKKMPGKKILLAGFSFGAAIAYIGSSKSQAICGLITVAPSAIKFQLDSFTQPSVPWCIIHGTDDEVISFNQVKDFVFNHTDNEVTFYRCNNVGHYFHGQLIKLRKYIEYWLQLNMPFDISC